VAYRACASSGATCRTHPVGVSSSCGWTSNGSTGSTCPTSDPDGCCTVKYRSRSTSFTTPRRRHSSSVPTNTMSTVFSSVTIAPRPPPQHFVASKTRGLGIAMALASKSPNLDLCHCFFALALALNCLALILALKMQSLSAFPANWQYYRKSAIIHEFNA